jgi:hypothetical protein
VHFARAFYTTGVILLSQKETVVISHQVDPPVFCTAFHRVGFSADLFRLKRSAGVW